MKKFLALILALVMAFSLVACSGGENPSGNEGNVGDGKTYALRMAIMEANIPTLGDYPEKIKEATGGRVTIEFVDVTSLGTATDALGMVREGAVDMYFNSAAQTGSEFPLMDMFQIPFLCSNPTDGTDLINAMYHAGYLDKELADFQPMFFVSSDMQMVFTSQNFSSVSDLATMKIRATSGTGASFIESTGASVVTMGLGDVYLALSTGVVDGAMSSPFMIRANKLNETAPYLLDAYVFGGAIMCLMNNDTWNSLPADIQAAILEVNAQHGDWIKWDMTRCMLEDQNYLTSNGMTLVTLSDAEMEKLVSGCSHLEADWIKKVTDLGYDGQAMIDYAKTVLGYYSLGK